MPSMGQGAAEGLQQVLQRLFLEAEAKRQQRNVEAALAEKARETDMRHQIDLGQLDLGRGNIDLRAKEFDRAIGRDKVEDDRYTEQAPTRAANLRYIGAQATNLENQPTRDAANQKFQFDLENLRSRNNIRERLASGQGDGGVGAVVKESIGPDGKPTLLSVNPRTNQATPIQMPPGYQTNRPARPVTVAERNAAGFFNRALNAEREARAVEDALSGVDLAALDYAPGFMGNLALSSNAQKYRNAQRTFTEARLRKESGAAIPQNEYDTDRTTNFRTSGDKGMSQKRKQRLETLRGLGASAGQGLTEFFGEGKTLDDLLQEFAEAEAQSAAPVGIKIIREIK